MRKIIVFAGIMLLFGIGFCYAQEEKLTITTYYPSPYGVYRELRSQRLAIGDNYYDPSKYCWPGGSCWNTIDANADLVVEGNVGIGTTSGGAKLHISQSSNVEPAALVINSGGSGEGLRIQAGAGGPGYAVFNAAKYNGTSLLYVRGDGNVGIGTTNPGAKLEVAGNIIASSPTANNHVATKEYVDSKASTDYVIRTRGIGHHGKHSCSRASDYPAPSCPAGWKIENYWHWHAMMGEWQYICFTETLCKKE